MNRCDDGHYAAAWPAPTSSRLVILSSEPPLSAPGADLMQLLADLTMWPAVITPILGICGIDWKV